MPWLTGVRSLGISQLSCESFQRFYFDHDLLTSNYFQQRPSVLPTCRRVQRHNHRKSIPHGRARLVLYPIRTSCQTIVTLSLVIEISCSFLTSQAFATTLGLAAVALVGDPAMPNLTPAQVSAGLPAPSAAAALLGKSGAAVMLVLLFLAVTSATSAELIAVSSILTYDVYKVTATHFLDHWYVD